MPPLPRRKTLVVGRNASCIGELFGTGSFGVKEGPVSRRHTRSPRRVPVSHYRLFCLRLENNTRCSWAGHSLLLVALGLGLSLLGMPIVLRCAVSLRFLASWPVSQLFFFFLQCPMERIRCEKCNTKYFQVDEAAHVAVCEEEDVDCPREGCEEFVLRRELDAHSLVCQFHP